MPEHRKCPHCGAENLTGEIICFACGEPLGQRPRPHDRAPVTPWIFYLGGLALLGLGGVAAYYLSLSLSAFSQGAGIPAEYLIAGAVALALVGQWGFYSARREDRSYWDLKRAPQLPPAQAEPGDAVWLRGSIACDTPLTVPYGKGEPCVYLEVTLRRRDFRGNWETVLHQKQAADFRLQDSDASIYVPSAGLSFDEIPVFIDTYTDADEQAIVRALLVGWKVSICGRVAGEVTARRVESLSDGVPALVTWQYRDTYIDGISKEERGNRRLGWGLSVLAAVVLLAACVR